MLTPLRFSPLGQWYRAEDGRGALLISADLLPDEASRQRLVATVLRLRQLADERVLGIADLVADEGRVWLLAAAPVEPCLSDLIGASDSRLELPAARVLLRDMAGGLAALRAAGLAHGGLSPQTVVVTPDGRATLAEAALTEPLLGAPVDAPADDVGWSAVATTLAAQWGRADGPGMRALLAAAGIARSQGLDAALAAIGAEPSEPAARAAIADAARPATTARTPAPPAGPEPEVDAARAAPAVDAVPLGAATMLGKRRPTAYVADRDDGLGMRFGPGVPASAATPTALATADLLAHRADDARRRTRRVARRRWIVTLLVVAAVLGYLLWRSSWTVGVRQPAVTANVAATGACQATIDFTGRIGVSGAGQLRYQWLRSDGTRSAVEHHNVLPGQGSITVHLLWSFSGPGRYDATARLRVWGRSTVTGQGSATYNC